MRQYKKRIPALLLVPILGISLLFTGCSIGDRQVYFASKSGGHTVFKIGRMACSREEAKVYLANYKNLYGKIYDTICGRRIMIPRPWRKASRMRSSVI